MRVLIPVSALPELRTTYRYTLQRGAGELVPLERVRHCMWTPHGSTVDVMHKPGTENACFKGLQTCGSVWHCPVCAAKISERRREEIAKAVQLMAARSKRAILVTYTIRHRQGDNLTVSLDAMLRARQTARSGRWAQDFAQRFGLVGSIRALEVTVGENGWHPHIHEIMFVDAAADPHELEQQLQARWASMVGKAGLRDVNEHGVKVQWVKSGSTEDPISGYITKFGADTTWDESHELAKGAVRKKGRGDSLSPMELLAQYCFAGHEPSGELWKEYAAAFKGRRQLAWSKGLRELLGLGEDKTDEEVAEETEDYSEHVCTLDREQWRIITGNDLRAELLKVAGSGDREAVGAFLQPWGVEIVTSMDPNEVRYVLRDPG